MKKALCYYCMTPTMDDGRCLQCGRSPQAPKPDSMALPPGTLLDGGGIMLGETVGEGGFGITYIAQDKVKDRIVCV